MHNITFLPGLLPGISPGEIIVIFLVVLLIFGPKKLPEVGKALGECVLQFKKASNGLGEVEKVSLKKENEINTNS